MHLPDFPRRLLTGAAATAWPTLAAAACSLILTAGCASQAPQHPAAASPKPSVAAATARPSSPVTAVPSPVPAVPNSAPPAASTVPLCEEPDLAATARRYNIGGGMWGVVITLTNTATASCSMYGYPGLGLIVLAPGQSASSSVALSQGTQRSPWASYLEVTPPGNYQYALVGLPYGLGDTSGDLYATAMARQTVIYRGGPGGCGCSGVVPTPAGT
jgi:hypothetical protein